MHYLICYQVIFCEGERILKTDEIQDSFEFIKMGQKVRLKIRIKMKRRNE